MYKKPQKTTGFKQATMVRGKKGYSLPEDEFPSRIRNRKDYTVTGKVFPVKKEDFSEIFLPVTEEDAKFIDSQYEKLKDDECLTDEELSALLSDDD